MTTRKNGRILSHAYSESEADKSSHFYSHVNQLPSLPEDNTYRYDRLNSVDRDGNQTDDMDEDERVKNTFILICIYLSICKCEHTLILIYFFA
jgi:hypothetical protein